MTVSIRDVARQARVSATTVSRVINDNAPVAKDTRRRILEAIEALNYVPHGGARSLITRKTATLASCCRTSTANSSPSSSGASDLTARQNGYHLLVSSSHSDRSEVEAMLRALRGRVDGLIVMSPEADAQALRANLPSTCRSSCSNCRVEGSDL